MGSLRAFPCRKVRVALLWRERAKKFYVKGHSWTLHFGRLNGRWSYGLDGFDG